MDVSCGEGKEHSFVRSQSSCFLKWKKSPAPIVVVELFLLPRCVLSKKEIVMEEMDLQNKKEKKDMNARLNY